jgi:hypothetical protein
MALAHFQRTFTDAAGNVKPGLSVTVRRESDNGLAALFADAGSVTPKSNPFNTDANGYGSFYVTDGRYRIQATDIDWRNEDLISQPSPNFASMPQVGGDPIVESGSNADGSWTRWADGTQIVNARISPDVTLYARGSIFGTSISATFPVTFVGTARTLDLSGNHSGGQGWGGKSSADHTPTVGTFQYYGYGPGSGVGTALTYAVIGRWK